MVGTGTLCHGLINWSSHLGDHHCPRSPWPDHLLVISPFHTFYEDSMCFLKQMFQPHPTCMTIIVHTIPNFAFVPDRWFCLIINSKKKSTLHPPAIIVKPQLWRPDQHLICVVTYVTTHVTFVTHLLYMLHMLQMKSENCINHIHWWHRSSIFI